VGLSNNNNNLKLPAQFLCYQTRSLSSFGECYTHWHDTETDHLNWEAEGCWWLFDT